MVDLLLIVEIVSPGSEAMDELVKRHEYARAGIPRYWVVQTGEYEVVTMMPLAWLLNTEPGDHLS